MSHNLYACGRCMLGFDTGLHVPKLASCGHNICAECAADERDDATCPNCGLETFFKDFLITNELAVELLHQLTVCRQKIESLTLEPKVPQEIPVEVIQPAAASHSTNNISKSKKAQSCSKNNHRISSTGSANIPNSEGSRIIILNPNPEWTVPDINEKFGAFGKILDSYARRNPQGLLFAFEVVFQDNSASKGAIEVMHQTPNGCGKLICVEYRNNRPRVKNKNPRMHFLPDRTIKIQPLGNVNEDDLRNIFEEHGKIIRCRRIRDNMGRPLGHALIEYESQESAEEAVTKKYGYHFPGSDNKITVEECNIHQ